MAHSIALLLLCAATAAAAQDVALIGLLGDRAVVLAVGGGEPKTVRLGQTWNGIKVLAVGRDEASVEIGGKPRTLRIGQHYRAAPAAAVDRQSATLAADPRGHFTVEGMINGKPQMFLVDTGATAIALPVAEARRLGIDYLKGERGLSRTAGGVVPVYRVRFDSVKIGGIELLEVDGIVIEENLGIALLGMTFLNRVEMQRQGQTMTLIRRF